MAVKPTEYGSRGIVGIGVPQANPTVEQEMFALRPAGLSLVTTRLTSRADGLEQRLRDYIERTVDYARRFDDLAIDAFAIACTGSSYLLGAQAEQALLRDSSAELGYPVISAAGAITETLKLLGVGRIGIVSPYPDWLATRACEFWSGAGYEVAAIRGVQLRGANVHAIYELSSADALAVARELDPNELDAILFTGTGMPTLGAIAPLAEATGLPVLSSNLCLLSAVCRKLGLSSDPLLPLPAGLDTTTL
jgi:maleate isomerase